MHVSAKKDGKSELAELDTPPVVAREAWEATRQPKPSV